LQEEYFTEFDRFVSRMMAAVAYAAWFLGFFGMCLLPGRAMWRWIDGSINASWLAHLLNLLGVLSPVLFVFASFGALPAILTLMGAPQVIAMKQ
jgi:hypothetical protein